MGTSGGTQWSSRPAQAQRWESPSMANPCQSPTRGRPWAKRERRNFSPLKWGPVYTLYSDYNVVILYDGTFVEVIPAPWVKGQHCGICGNFDGNTKNEMEDKTGAVVPADMLSRAWCQQ